MHTHTCRTKNASSPLTPCIHAIRYLQPCLCIPLITGKFKNAEMLSSTFNLAASTNHTHPIRVEGDDRRHVMIKTSLEHAQDPEYWDERWGATKDPVVQRIFYRYLYNMDLSGFNPRTIPDSELRAQNQLASRPMLAVWLEDVLTYGWDQGVCSEGIPPKELGDGVGHVLRSEAVLLYSAFAKRMGDNKPISPNLLGQQLVAALEGACTISSCDPQELGYPPGFGPLKKLSPTTKPGTFKFASRQDVIARLQAKNWWGQ